MDCAVDVPEIFRPRTCFEYPRYNYATYEEQFFDYFQRVQPQTRRKYLPVLWSIAYYKQRGAPIPELQTFLNSLDPNEKYFSIVVYDGGVHENIKHLDIKLFSAVGESVWFDLATSNTGDRVIPLITAPAPNINKTRSRDILAGFIGAPTHPVREVLWQTLTDIPGFVVERSVVNPVTSHEVMDEVKWAQVNYARFQDIMERSVFALCPRGSGNITYRICESLQYGCIPIYISDKFWFPWADPHNPDDHGIFDQIGIACHVSELQNLPHMLTAISPERIAKYLENGQKIYASHFEPDSISARIINEVNGQL